MLTIYGDSPSRLSSLLYLACVACCAASRPFPASVRSRADRHRFSKVPEITAYFWAIKALSTAMGESTSDYLVHAMNPELAE